MNFCSNLSNFDLISELKKRSLPIDGSKDDLMNILRDAILQENLNEIYNEEENYDSEDDKIEECNENKTFKSNGKGSLNETCLPESVTDDLFASNNTNEKCINNRSEITKVNKGKIFKKINGDKNTKKLNKTNEVIIIDDDIAELNKRQSKEDDSQSEIERNIVWIYKINKNVKAVELKDLFDKYGKVLSVKIVMNGKSTTGNCFGCIQLNDNEAVENSIKYLNKTEFRGKIISVTKNVYDITHAELIEGNISPISSNDPWSSDGKINSKLSVKPVKRTLPKVIKNDTKSKDSRYSNGPINGKFGSRSFISDREYKRPFSIEGRGRMLDKYDRVHNVQREYKRPMNDIRDTYGGRDVTRKDEEREWRPERSRDHSYDNRPPDSYQRRPEWDKSRYEPRYDPLARDRQMYRQDIKRYRVDEPKRKMIESSRFERFYEKYERENHSRPFMDLDDPGSFKRPRLGPDNVRREDWRSERGRPMYYGRSCVCVSVSLSRDSYLAEKEVVGQVSRSYQDRRHDHAHNGEHLSRAFVRSRHYPSDDEDEYSAHQRTEDYYYYCKEDSYPQRLDYRPRNYDRY